MANTYKDIVITPNKGSATDDPKIVFSGGNTSVNTDITMRVYPDSNGTLSFEGSAGQLFSITNDLTGSLFSVNDVSGLPLIDVNVNSQAISLGPYYGNVAIGQTSASERLVVYRDTDNSAEIGRAHIGFVGYGDFAGFSHVDMNISSNYALLQGAQGETFLNAASGQPIYFRNGNTDRMILSGANVGIGTTSPVSSLSVAGNILAPSFNTNTSYTIGIQDAQTNSFVNTKRGSLIIQASSAVSGIQGMGAGDLTLKAGDSYSSSTDIDGDVIVKAGYNFYNTPFSRGKITFTTNNTERMRIDANGNVAIGQTTTPERLTVYRDTDNSAEIGRAHIGFVGAADYAGFSHVDQNAIGSYALLQDNAGGTYLNAAAGQLIYFRTGNNDRMVLSGANVGIGITSPVVPLDVVASNSNALHLRLRGRSSDSVGQMEFWNNAGSVRYGIISADSTAFSIGAIGSLPLTFGTALSERMRITSGGNVGIGTTAPASVIHAVGTQTIVQALDAAYTLWKDATPTKAWQHTLVTNDALGVRHYNGSSWSELMRIDTSGNVGIGVTPSTGITNWSHINIKGTGSTIRSDGSSVLDVAQNLTGDGKYAASQAATQYRQNGGSHIWYIAGSGTAGNPVTFTQAMTLDGSGNLGLGTTSITALGTGYTTMAIQGTNGAGFRLYAGATEYSRLYGDSTGTILQAVGATPILFWNTAERMRIDATGNVCIGVTSSTFKLDVNGAARISGTLTSTGAMTDDIGDVRDIVINNQTAAYVPTVTDAGKTISITTGGVTLPNTVFSAGQAVTIFNNSAASQTIASAGAVTTYLAGTATTGSRTLAQRGVCTALCVAANTFVISGAGLT